LIFITLKLEIEAYNSKSIFGYDCDSSDSSLSLQYAGMYCYDSDSSVPNNCGSGGSESCAGHIYNTEIVEVTVIDDDHSGDVNSTVRDWSDQVQTFESDMDIVFTNYFHGEDGENKNKFPEFADYIFQTKVYEGMEVILYNKNFLKL